MTDRRSTIRRRLAATLFVLSLAPGVAAAQQGDRFDLGLRFDVVTGNGEPTNDILSYGLFGHWRLDERWSVGFGLDHAPEFDFERVPELLSLTTAEVIDAKGTATAASAWAERVYGRETGRWEWFWGAGLGLVEVDVDPILATTAGGDPFHVETDAGSEFLALAHLGLRRALGRHWALEGALRVEQHFADWTLTERVSGRTAAIDDYFVKGGHLAIARSF